MKGSTVARETSPDDDTLKDINWIKTMKCLKLDD